MMLPMESRFILIFTIFYNFYLLVSISGQLLLLYLMLKCPARSLNDMRIYLFNILALQFIATSSAYMLQCRAVPSTETLAMLCYGPCKYLGTSTCTVVFHVLEASLIACATSLIITFYYRYETLTTNSFTRSGHYKQLVISYCVPLVFLVLEIVSPNDLEKVMTELKSAHPTYDVENYALLGFSEVKSVLSTVQTLMLLSACYGTSIIALILRRKIMKILSTKTHHAEKIEQTRSLILGLTIQTVFPLLCYCPSLTYYIYAQYTNSSSQLFEFLTSPFGFLYTLVDPFLTIYYVLPYRRTFKLLISKRTAPAPANRSETQTSRRNDLLKL